MKPNPACVLLTASLLPLSALWLSAADDTSTSTQPTSAAQAAQMQSVQRQQLVISANQAVADGQRLLGSGKYDDAAARFQFALDSLTTGGVSAHLHERAAAGLAAAKAGQAQNLAKETKFAQAATLLQQAITLEPNNPDYPKAQLDLQQQQMA